MLGCPRASAISHDTSGHLDGICPDDPATVHVTTTDTANRSPRGVTLHRTRSLAEDEVTRRHGLPTTTAARTLQDLAATNISPKLLRRAVTEALAERLTNEAELHDAAGHGRNGAPRLRNTIDDGPDEGDSPAVEKLVRGLHEAGVNGFEVDAWYANRRPDILFRDLKIAVEVKGFKHHGALRSRFESDHDRELELKDAGLQVLAFTARKIDRELPKVVARIVRELGRAEGR